MNHKTGVLAVSGLAALAALALLTEPAFAQDGAVSAQDAGKSISEVVRDVAFPIIGSIAGAMGIAALVKRDVGMAMTLLVLVLILSGFLMENSPIDDIAQGIWEKIGGSGGEAQGDPVPGPGT